MHPKIRFFFCCCFLFVANNAAWLQHNTCYNNINTHHNSNIWKTQNQQNKPRQQPLSSIPGFTTSRNGRRSTKIFVQQQQQDEQQQKQPQKRRKKKNKYAKFSKIDGKNSKEEQQQQQQVVLDPFEQLIAESKQKLEQLEMDKQQQKADAKNTKQINPQQSSPDVLDKIQKQKQQSLSFPDTTTIDPYDPTTFGYIEIGTIVGAHGVHGWVKIRAQTDFPQERLLQAGLRHIKPYQKRAPRKIVLLGGKPLLGNKKSPAGEEEYLLQFEDVTTREEAQTLRGSTLYARQEERVLPIQKTDDDSYDHDDILEEQEEEADDKPERAQKQKQPKETKKQEEEEEYLVSDLVGLEVFLLPDDDDKSGSNMFVGTVAGIVLAQEMCAIPGLGHDMLELALPQKTLWQEEELVLIPFVPEIVPKVSLAKQEIWITPPPGLLDLTYVREEKVRIKGFLPPAKE